MVDRRDFMRLLVGTGTAIPWTRPSAAAPKKPNIIFIMLDDLGKEWVHCYGSEHRLTPHVDRLAASGMKFENVYSKPLCVATRATLITGQYPAHHGWVNDWNVPSLGVGYFDPSYYPSVARLLRKTGYATAVAGKWQLNDFRDHPDILDEFGFDAYCMWTGVESGNEVVSRNRYWNPYIHTKQGSRTYQDEFGEDVFTRFLIGFLRQRPDVPKFVYYPMCLPHYPRTTTPRSRVGQGAVRSMIYYADFKLGQIIGALNRSGLRDRTIVIWTSDNGSPVGSSAERNGRMVSGGKGTLMEPGINVPFVVSGPGLVAAGTTSDALIDFTDLLPTFAELGGATLPSGGVFDGKSFAAHLLGREADGPRRWIMSMGGGRAQVNADGRLVPARPYAERVLRDKRYKLLVGEDHTSRSLIDLANDPDERNNLLDSAEPEHRSARERLEGALRTLPPVDAAPRYDPLPARP